VGTFLKRAKLYEQRMESLNPDDRKRLELHEQDIATGTEDYRAADINGVRIAYFDFGFIAFRPLRPGWTLLIAFRFFEIL
jgi:hypothetical protein